MFTLVENLRQKRRLEKILKLLIKRAPNDLIQN